MTLAMAVALGSAAAACSVGQQAHANSVNVGHATSLIDQYLGVPKFVPPGPAFNPSSAKGKKVFIIPVSASVPFNVYFGKALEQALAKFDIKTTYYSDTGLTSQWVAGMNTAISEKVKAIALIDVDPKEIAPEIAAAKSAGIAVFDADFLDASHPYAQGYKSLAAWNDAPYVLAGKLEAAWAIKSTAGKGTVIVINSPDLLSADDVNTGIHKEFAQDCPSCKVVTINVPFNDWSTRLQSTLASASVAPEHVICTSRVRLHGGVRVARDYRSWQDQHCTHSELQRGPGPAPQYETA